MNKIIFAAIAMCLCATASSHPYGSNYDSGYNALVYVPQPVYSANYGVYGPPSYVSPSYSPSYVPSYNPSAYAYAPSYAPRPSYPAAVPVSSAASASSSSNSKNYSPSY